MADIHEVRVDLKFSKEVAENEWVSIGLGASASVSQGETFEMAIQEVEHQLRVEMRQSWGRIRRDKPQEADRREAAQVLGDEEVDELPQPAQRARRLAEEPPIDPSWCEIHKVKMKMRSWGGYSHQLGEQWCQGHWCLEHTQPFKKSKKGGIWLHAHEDPDTGETLWCREDGEQEEIRS